MPMVIPVVAGAVAVGGAIAAATDGDPGDSDITYKANDPYDIDESAAQSNKFYEAQANDARFKVDSRTAPTMQAAQLGPASQAAQVQIAANERSANQNIGAVNTATAANTGPANQMGFASINRQDQEGRAGQQQLVGSLQDQAAGRGPSLAGSMLRDAQDRNAKQTMSMAASMKGNGNAALVQRNAANQFAAGNQGAAHDAAQMRVQEQLNAQGQLGQQLGNMRSQDIGVNTSQAGLMQDSYLNNMNANNNFALQNAQFGQQVGLANMGAANQRQQDQAAMNMQNAQFNAGMTNQYNNNQAGLMQGANFANQNALNQFMIQQGQFQQGANQNNLNSSLQTQAQKDAMTQYYMNTAVGIDQANTNRNMTIEQMKTNQDMGVQVQDQAAYQAAQAAKERNLDRVIGGVEKVGEAAAMAGGSDKNMKKNVRKANFADSPIATSDASAKIETSSGGGFDPDAASAAPAAAAAGKKKPGGGMGGGSILDKVNTPKAESPEANGRTLTPDWNVLAGNVGQSNDWHASTVSVPTTSNQRKSFAYQDDVNTDAVSDKRSKKESFYTEGDTQALLNGIRAHEYEYKDPSEPGAGEGTFVSPMAQELEKTKLGKNMVFEGPNGHKMVDYGKGFGFMMAAMATMNERLNELDKKKRK